MGKMEIFPIPMIAVAAFSAIAIVVVSFPMPSTAGPTIGVAFNNVAPIPVTAAAFTDTTVPAAFAPVPITAGTICNSHQ